MSEGVELPKDISLALLSEKIRLLGETVMAYEKGIDNFENLENA